jgi:hypothetical protein
MGNMPFGKVLEDNIKMDCREVCFENGRPMELTLDRVKW